MNCDIFDDCKITREDLISEDLDRVDVFNKFGDKIKREVGHDRQKIV